MVKEQTAEISFTSKATLNNDSWGAFFNSFVYSPFHFPSKKKKKGGGGGGGVSRGNFFLPKANPKNSDLFMIVVHFLF